MNKTNLKRYAPQARKDFIAAVTARAQLLGLSEVAGQTYAEPCEVNGDVAVIAGRPWPASVQGKRERLLQRMKRDGYAATLEAVAYTWFNRFAALRYMELHDYLGHGRHVLSNPDGALPEILSHALELAESGDLPGLQAEQVRQLKLDNQDGELYRRVLIAQCNALHGAMPFLFEAIDDETELLLPENLLLSDSVVAKLVAEIPEEDWAEVEIIGWLYQFYISEKKDEVIGKVVKSEDIPAATQLFTPNWIVQYLVQNSVGRLWLMANPSSTLASQWPYYIQPADQTPEVQAQLDALIQARIREDGEALNPETITVLDPACGSGHILVVAYDVLKAIYLERGYQPRAIPRLILEKNLHGLDIDDRAAQLAAFALLMKARADDRRLFNDPPKLNVLSLQESKDLEVDELATRLAPFGPQRALLKALIDTFEHAKTFGSLIQIPAALNGQLAAMAAGLQQAVRDGDLYAQQAAKDLLPLVWQALVLGMQFDAVVANPPYMSAKGLNGTLKPYAQQYFPESKADLFSMFIERGFHWCKSNGFNSLVTMQGWMFLSSFADFRKSILGKHSLLSLIQLPYDGRSPTAMGINFGVSLEVFQKQRAHKYEGTFDCYRYYELTESGTPIHFPSGNNRNVTATQDDFELMPGNPIAYWVSKKMRMAFDHKKLEALAEPAGRCKTTNDEKFVRRSWEVEYGKLNKKWIYLYKGGASIKYYGNRDYVIDWSNPAREFYASVGGLPKEQYWGKEGISWTFATSSDRLAFRLKDGACQYSTVSPTIVFKCNDDLRMAICLLNGVVADRLLKILNPTLGLNIGDVLNIPLDNIDIGKKKILVNNADVLIEIAKSSFNSFETSLDFSSLCFCGGDSLGSAWMQNSIFIESNVSLVREKEEENNRIFIEAFGLQDELAPDVTEDQVTLARADREKDGQRLISYAIGCMMGRYSLDEPGLIYAHVGNVGFDPSRYEKKFPADADGIVPITDERWFEDDAASRVREFLRSVWGADTLDENMAWLAESLGTKGSETPDETVRRYLADKFFKDHLQTYKKRPIYWLFSSGKQGAFQALVYLHRYHQGTLARMRSEYVLPLTGKMQARMESLEVDIRQASSTAARNKLTKQLDALRKHHHELLAYDEKLRHYADQRISIDLDDGVKVNYGKFGDLLAEVKAITGGAGDE